MLTVSLSHCLSLSREPATVLVSVLLWVRLDTLHKSGQTYSCTDSHSKCRIQKTRLLMFPFLLAPGLSLVGLSTAKPQALCPQSGLVPLKSSSPGFSSAYPSPSLQVPFLAWLRSLLGVPFLLPPPSQTRPPCVLLGPMLTEDPWRNSNGEAAVASIET